MSKFSTRTAERLYNESLNGMHDAECGDVSYCGWYARFDNAVPDTGGYIVRQDNDGFVDAMHYSTTDRLMSAWNGIESYCARFMEE